MFHMHFIEKSAFKIKSRGRSRENLLKCCTIGESFREKLLIPTISERHVIENSFLNLDFSPLYILVHISDKVSLKSNIARVPIYSETDFSLKF